MGKMAVFRTFAVTAQAASDRRCERGLVLRFCPKPAAIESPSDELLHVDLLRFIAAYAIVLLHSAQGASGALAGIMAHSRHFYLVVDLFLVISGFIIAFVYARRLHTRAQYATFLWRRVARLAPLHWATLLVFVALGLPVVVSRFHTGSLTNYDWNCLIPNAAALQAFGVCRGLSFNYVNWSISAEMGMYLIAPALLWVGRRGAGWLLLLSFGAMIALCVYAPAGDPWYGWTWHFGVIRAFPDFCLGVALFFFRRDIARIPLARWLLFIALAGFFVGALLDWPDALLLALLYLAALGGIATDLKGAPRDAISALGVYGQLTYSMYMLHPLIMIALVAVIGQHLLHLSGTALNGWLLLSAAMVAPISYMSLIWFEMPARRWLAGLRNAAA